MVKFKLGRILTLSIQILTRFFLTYISSTLQDYTSASFYIIWLLAFLNIFFFLLACLKNPGYLPKPSVKHSKQEYLSNSHMDFTISRYHNEYEDQSCNESDRPHINIEELPDQIYTLNENRRFQSSSPVPQKEISQSSESDESAPVVHDQLSVSNIQSQKFELTTANPKVSISDSPEVYFCKACTMVQPPRAHHCKECDKCVALFDHHCPWIGNCIGEKNKLVFYFMILGLCLEGWIGFYMVINAVEMKKEWVTIAQLICAAGLVGMNSYLSIFLLIHSALILLNVTTYEVISWERIYYLNDKSICSSPFYKGLRSSLRVLCDHSNKITDWNI